MKRKIEKGQGTSLTELRVGAELHWYDISRGDDNFAREHKFVFEGHQHEVVYSDWGTHGVCTVFKSIDTLADGTPQFLVLIEEDTILSIIKADPKVNNRRVKLLNDLHSEKKRFNLV